MKKLRTILIGTTPMANKLIALLEHMDCVDLISVINLKPQCAVNRSNYDPMLKLLRDCPHKLHYISNINHPSIVEWLEAYQPDLIIQAGWSQIFREQILEIPKLFCLGIHSAPLPEGRGGAILNWKLIEGGGKWGCSLFIMEKGIDTGRVLDFEPFELELRDNIRTAYLKADRVALKMIKRTLPLIANDTFTIKSQIGKGSYYHSRKPKDGKMEFEWSIEKILDYVRALTHPYPGAFFETKFGKLIVWKAEEIGLPLLSRKVGTIMAIQKGKGLIIKVGIKDIIRLTEITPPNDVETWADLWVLEKGLKEGDSLV